MAGFDPAIPGFDATPADEGMGARDEPGHGLKGPKLREVWFPEVGSTPCPVHGRDDLVAGETLAGPAIIEAMDSTIVVPPDWVAAVGGTGYIRLRRR